MFVVISYIFLGMPSVERLALSADRKLFQLFTFFYYCFQQIRFWYHVCDVLQGPGWQRSHHAYFHKSK